VLAVVTRMGAVAWMPDGVDAMLSVDFLIVFLQKTSNEY
jgi:hypothetical protein